MENVTTAEGKWFDRCLIALLVATLAVNLLSAFIRHQEAGLGCAPWPDCYALVGTPVDPATAGPTAVLTPAETAKQAHRGIATGLVLLVILVVYQARQRPLTGFTQHLPLLLVAVIILLSVIGPASYLKTLPAVATANITGGIALLTLTWLLWLRTRPPPPERHPALRRLAQLSLVALVLQIFLGAWVSANFAGIACQGFLACGDAAPGGGLSSFWYLRELALTESGRIVLDGAQVLIQQAHHLGAILTSGLVLLLSLRAMAAGGLLSRWAILLLCLLLLQISAGFLNIHFGLPLPIVLAHNLTASLLLLTVIRVLLLTADHPS